MRVCMCAELIQEGSTVSPLASRLGVYKPLLAIIRHVSLTSI